MDEPQFPKEDWWPWTWRQIGLVKLLQEARWLEIEVPPPPPQGSPESDRENEQLLDMMRKRTPEQIAEIISQDTDPPFKFFGDIVGATEKTHPWTFVLMQAMIPPGLATSMFHKNRYNRARPTQVIKGLTFVLPEVPGHPAYPSGHSQQAHMIAAALAAAADPPETKCRALFDLAWGIAVNREIAGVHFRSDSDAGRDFAALLIPYVLDVYADFLSKAQDEWRDHVWDEPDLAGAAPEASFKADDATQARSRPAISRGSRWTDGGR